MRVHPTIAALRGDRAPQRHAQKAMKRACDRWRVDPNAAQVLLEFPRFGRGAALEDCPRLEAMFTGQGTAEALMARLVGEYCRAMASNPLGHPPFRHGYNGTASTLLLARSGRAQLLLQAREPGTYDSPCATFTDALRYDAVLAGEGAADLLRIRGGRDEVAISRERLDLAGGMRLALDCSSETLDFRSVSRRLVTVRLLRSASEPEPSREYCLASGQLQHLSSGSLANSRREMMVALLGRMQRTDAAPVLARMALRAGDDSLRWQALRECLALDTAQGFATLVKLARAPQDSLSGPAGALRAQLIEAHPQLLEWEEAQCPAG